MTEEINCNNCDASKYGGFFKDETEYCLKFNQKLESNNGHTYPCKECNGKYFKQDTWGGD